MVYSLARNSAAATSGNAAADVASPTASGVLFRLLECGIFLGAATASTYGLNRSTSLGTRTTPVALLAEEATDPALSGILLVDMAVAFTGEPGKAAQDLRLIGLPATIGVGVIWTFPKGLKIASQLSFNVVNRATNSASVNVYFVCDL